MGKYDGILLMSDFDGTLSHHRTISQENCDAIRYFQSEGGLFSLATGRQPDWIEQWKEFVLPNTYSATLNGAVLCDPTGKNRIYDQPINEDFWEIANEIVKACPDYLEFHFHGNCVMQPFLIGEPLDLALIPSPLYKMVFHMPDRLSDEYTARIAHLVQPRGYISMRSCAGYIEVQNGKTGKGNAVRRLKEHLGDAAALTVAVGDYENDIDMIKAADIGYAVANAHPALLAVADRVTVKCTEHALAHIIEELANR